jgi:hypothetical protein
MSSGLSGCVNKGKVYQVMVKSCQVGCIHYKSELAQPEASKDPLEKCFAFCKALPYEVEKEMAK